MAISPVSDLILDVARAADPQQAQAASRALNADSSTAGADFSASLRSATPTAAPALDGLAAARDTSRYAYRTPAPTITAAMTPARKAAMGLESVLLKGMVEEMMPKDAADVYGSGLAGDVWRSMLSEKIADEVAKSGALHIADRLFATHQDLLQSSDVNKIRPAHQPIDHTKIKI